MLPSGLPDPLLWKVAKDSWTAVPTWQEGQSESYGLSIGKTGDEGAPSEDGRKELGAGGEEGMERGITPQARGENSWKLLSGAAVKSRGIQRAGPFKDPAGTIKGESLLGCSGRRVI